MFKTCSDCGVINYSKTAKLENRLIDCLKAISFIEFSESSQNVRKKTCLGAITQQKQTPKIAIRRNYLQWGP